MACGTQPAAAAAAGTTAAVPAPVPVPGPGPGPVPGPGPASHDALQRTPGDKLSVELKKLAKRLHRQVGQAIADFNMIEDGDKVMVCVSGGKDSHALLDILLHLRERGPLRFDVVAVNLDQKQPGFPAEVLPAYLSKLGVPFHIETRDTYSTVKRLIEPGKTMCGLCSRLRRGILYRVATGLGATKIALGHHRDDMLQTLFMNMFFGGRLKGMPPKLLSDDGCHIVIRPLAHVAESDLRRWAEHRAYPIIPCTLCGTQDNLQRVQIGQMLRDWQQRFPGRIDNLVHAMGHVHPSHLMDRNLYPFGPLQRTGVAQPDGDRAFDADDDGGSPGAPLATRRIDVSRVA